MTTERRQVYCSSLCLRIDRSQDYKARGIQPPRAQSENAGEAGHCLPRSVRRVPAKALVLALPLDAVRARVVVAPRAALELRRPPVAIRLVDVMRVSLGPLAGHVLLEEDVGVAAHADHARVACPLLIGRRRGVARRAWCQTEKQQKTDRAQKSKASAGRQGLSSQGLPPNSVPARCGRTFPCWVESTATDLTRQPRFSVDRLRTSADPPIGRGHAEVPLRWSLICYAGPLREPWAGREARRTIDVFSPEEVWALVRAAEAEQDSTLFLTASFTGLRMGELLALRWRCVDFARRSIRVERGFTLGTEDTPKSNRERVVPMAPEVEQALARLGQREDWTEDEDLVFCGSHGGHLSPSKLRVRYRTALDAAGLRRLRFHDLRHTFGSIAINRGSLVQVNAWMGHADIRTTQRYLHFKEHGDEAVHSLAGAFATTADPVLSPT